MTQMKRLPTPDLFPPPPNPAEAAKMSLKPVLKKQDVQLDVEPEEKPDMNATRTPSRLTFGEKLNKFKAISLDDVNTAPVKKSSKTQLEQPQMPPPGMVTSTPAIGRTLPLSKKQVRSLFSSLRRSTKQRASLLDAP